MVLRQNSTPITQQTQVAVGLALRPSVLQQSTSAQKAAAAPAPAAPAAATCAPLGSFVAPAVATKQLTTPTSVHQRRAVGFGKPIGSRHLQVTSPKLAVLNQGAVHSHAVYSSTRLPAGGTCMSGTTSARGNSRAWGNNRCRGKRGVRRAQSCNFPRSLALSSVRNAPDLSSNSDSLTAGFCSNGRQYEPYGRTLADAIHAGLEDSAPVEVAVCGHSGGTASEMVAWLEKVSGASFRMRRQHGGQILYSSWLAQTISASLKATQPSLTTSAASMLFATRLGFALWPLRHHLLPLQYVGTLGKSSGSALLRGLQAGHCQSVEWLLSLILENFFLLSAPQNCGRLTVFICRQLAPGSWDAVWRSVCSHC